MSKGKKNVLSVCSQNVTISHLLVAFRIYELYFLLLYSELIYFSSSSQLEIVLLSLRVFGNVGGILINMRPGSGISIVTPRGHAKHLTMCWIPNTTKSHPTQNSP